MKILFSNIGYARGLTGKFWHTLKHAHRHFYVNIDVQKKALSDFKKIIDTDKPDVCCLVEISNGAYHSSYYRQIEDLQDDDYKFHDIANKYGDKSVVKNLPLHEERCNAFLSKHDLQFEKIYMKYGTKRLLYKLTLPNNISLYFMHFSLIRKTRDKQFLEMRKLISDDTNDIIIMGDFNIMKGFSELHPLLYDSELVLMNNDKEFTHSSKKILDLCICSEKIAKNANLKIIQQSFSDHAALLLEF